ncbi:hypothetical protein F5X99DRAFT_84804 [Biscogniauxia marginata]|nr:hypothetical protein F5X99DRAFT_84804 [Biscogniauxia marginata]
MHLSLISLSLPLLLHFCLVSLYLCISVSLYLCLYLCFCLCLCLASYVSRLVTFASLSYSRILFLCRRLRLRVGVAESELSGSLSSQVSCSLPPSSDGTTMQKPSQPEAAFGLRGIVPS